MQETRLAGASAPAFLTVGGLMVRRAVNEPKQQFTDRQTEVIRQQVVSPVVSAVQSVETVTSSQISDSTAVGRSVLTAADAGAVRTAIGAQSTISQQAAISNPTGGATTDAEARTAINSILAALRTQGLIAT